MAMSIAGTILGIVITPLAMLAAMMSGGAGHGNYVMAKLLYPLPIVLTMVPIPGLQVLLFALCVLQFPIYGGAIGYSLENERPRLVGTIVIVHVLATIVCFSGLVSGF